MVCYVHPRWNLNDMVPEQLSFFLWSLWIWFLWVLTYWVISLVCRITLSFYCWTKSFGKKSEIFLRRILLDVLYHSLYLLPKQNRGFENAWLSRDWNKEKKIISMGASGPLCTFLLVISKRFELESCVWSWIADELLRFI